MPPQSINPNHTLHFEDHYQGLRIQFDKGPFIREYLDRLHQTLARSLNDYKRVFAFRFDLRFPDHLSEHNFNFDNQVIDRFIESFKAKIRHNRQMAKRENKYAHDTVVRYVWTREVGQLGRPHYHFAIFLNYDAFCSIGKFEPGRENMFNRLQEAWSSALGLPFSDIDGLVNFPANCYYHLNREDNPSIADFFYRVSYLCKSATKVYGDGHHGFGASRL
jgi:hypothetical protein